MRADTLGRRLPVLALVTANAVSLLGNVAALVAIPWFVLVTTGSAARTGLAAFFATIPLALGAFFGGAVADRIGPRRASIAGDLAGGAAIAGIPILHALGALEFWHVLALAFAGALFDAPAQAAREALLPDLADRAGMPRDRANALHRSTEHVGYVLGAPAGGLLIAAAGAPNALLLDASSFLVSAVLMLLVPGLRPAREAATYLADLLEGLGAIRRNALLLTSLAISTVGNLLISPLAAVVLPVYAERRFGTASSLAAMTAAYGAGGIVGNVLHALGSRTVSRRRRWVVFWIAYPPVSALLLPLPPLGPLLAALFAVGLLAGAVGPLEQSIRQEQTPPRLRARVFSTFIAAQAIVIPVGVLGAGVLIEAGGLRAVLAAFAGGNAVLAFAALRAPALRRL